MTLNKFQISWTHALRQIVINCYKFHGREDLLPAFNEEDDKSNVIIQQGTPHSSSHPSHSTSQGQSGGGQSQQQTVGVVRLSSTDSSKGNSSPAQIIAASPTALATATQVGVDRSGYKEMRIRIARNNMNSLSDRFCLARDKNFSINHRSYARFSIFFYFSFLCFRHLTFSDHVVSMYSTRDASQRKYESK